MFMLPLARPKLVTFERKRASDRLRKLGLAARLAGSARQSDARQQPD